MRSNPKEVRIEDQVVRAHHCCWITTAYKQVIDLTRYPRMGIVMDSDDAQPDLWAVVAFHKIDCDEDFEVLFESEYEDAAITYLMNLTQILQNPATNH